MYAVIDVVDSARTAYAEEVEAGFRITSNREGLPFSPKIAWSDGEWRGDVVILKRPPARDRGKATDRVVQRDPLFHFTFTSTIPLRNSLVEFGEFVVLQCTPPKRQPVSVDLEW